MNLIHRKCKPCEGDVSRILPEDIFYFNSQLQKPWQLVDDMKIVKDFNFNDYVHVMKFFNQVAELAETESHHPVMHIYFSKVRIELWTHAILGLSENDFILAAKIDQVYDSL